MDRKIFNYCERGLDPGFWAEPANALSNLAFLIAGGVCLSLWARTPQRSILAGLLAALMLAIGVGSFLFHTLAARWAALADTLPIALYMLLAVYVITRRLLRAPIWASWLALAGFIGLMRLGLEIRCETGPCLNGSVAYLPALAALLISGSALTMLRRPEGRPLLLASAIFAVSIGFRSLDREFCGALRLGEAALGTHFLWHLLNAATLTLVTETAIRAQRPSVAAVASAQSSASPK